MPANYSVQYDNSVRTLFNRFFSLLNELIYYANPYETKSDKKYTIDKLKKNK